MQGDGAWTDDSATEGMEAWETALSADLKRAALRSTWFFCLMAAWLNEGRCPGGRPSVSTN